MIQIYLIVEVILVNHEFIIFIFLTFYKISVWSWGFIKYANGNINIRKERSTSSLIIGMLEKNDSVKTEFLKDNWYAIFNVNQIIKDEKYAIGYVYAPLLFSNKLKNAIRYNDIMKDIEDSFFNMKYGPLSNGTPRYMGLSLDNGMSIEIVGNKSDVSSATLMYDVRTTNNELILFRMMVANLFLHNAVPEIHNTDSWLEERMTASVNHIKKGYLKYNKIDYFDTKTVTFKYVHSLNKCLIIVEFN